MGHCKEGCNICQSCYGCNTCQSGLTICKAGSQFAKDHLGLFNFRGESVASGQKFITSNAWNDLLIYIDNAYSLGELSHPIPPNLPRVNKGDSMLASMYNSVVDALNGLATTSSLTKHNPTDIIYGTYFSGISSYINNNWKILYTQCDTCNTTCDAGCNTCDICDYCKFGCDTLCDHDDGEGATVII